MRDKSLKNYLTQNWFIETPDILTKVKNELVFKTNTAIPKKSLSFRNSFALLLVLLLGVLIAINYDHSLPKDKNTPEGDNINPSPTEIIPYLNPEDVTNITQDDIPFNEIEKETFLQSYNELRTQANFKDFGSETENHLKLYEVIIETNTFQKITLYYSKEGFIIVQEEDMSYYYQDSSLFKEFIPKD